MTPRLDLALVGHVTQDLLAGGWRPGGTAAYAARAALDLGLKVAVVTSARNLDGFEEVLRGAQVFFQPAKETTTFENRYRGGHRTQRQLAQARALRASFLPAEAKRARAALLGPVMGEVPWTLARAFSSSTLVAACLQGWLRTVGPGRNVRPLPASRIAARNLRGLSVVFVSREDLGRGDAERAVAPWLGEVGEVLLTAGEEGATLLSARRRREVPAFAVSAQDPTGAGDTFAAGYLARLLETGDAVDAAHYASAAASWMVEQVGIGRLKTAEVQRRHAALMGQVGALRASHG